MESTIAINKKIHIYDEEKLVKEAIRGNSKAFAELLGNYKTYLYRIAYAYVKEENTALDIIQESTCKCWVKIKTLKDEKYFKTWITRIVINTAINMKEKNSKMTFLDKSNPVVDDKKELHIEEKLDLYNAIELLNSKYKMVIILKYFNDMSIDTIADVMDIPVNTVKSHLRRAKQELNKILKEDYLND